MYRFGRKQPAGVALTALVAAAITGSCLPTGGGAPAPLTLAGAWEGAVTVRGATESLTVTFTADSPSVAGTVTAADEYAIDLPLKAATRHDSLVHLELPDAMHPGSIDARLERGRMTGSYLGEQDGDSLRGTVELWRRPPPAAPYRAEEVRFRGGEGMLAGTLFIPAGPGAHPAIVFLHGSGPQTRDSYIRWFADRFARAGVAALIYDKRGTGASEGVNWMRSSAKFPDFANDGLAGVRFLRQRPDIDPARVGMWGLSQGAWLAPIAAVRSPDVAFLVILSGGGVSPAEQELYDDEVRLRELGYSESQIGDAVALLRLGDDFIRDGQDSTWNRLQSDLARARQQPWFRYLDKFPLILPRQAWWHGSELDYDPRPTLRALRAPILVILGDHDLSTPTRPTAERITAALRDGGNPDYTVTIVPGADHAMQVGPDPWVRLRLTGQGGVPASAAAAARWDWMRPAPGWEAAMVAWVVRRARVSAPAAR